MKIPTKKKNQARKEEKSSGKLFQSATMFLLFAAATFVLSSFTLPLPPFSLGIAALLFLSCAYIFFIRYNNLKEKLQYEQNRLRSSSLFLKKIAKKYSLKAFFNITVPMEGKIYAFDAIFFLPRLILIIQHFPEENLKQAIEQYAPNSSEKGKFIRSKTPILLKIPDQLLNTMIDNFPVDFPLLLSSLLVLFKNPQLFTWHGFDPKKIPLLYSLL